MLEQARAEIRRSWRRTCADNAGHRRAAELFDPDRLPAFHDPFAGGGALPLEAQRLGLEAHASDLNPVAVLINKAMIEIPPKFAGRPPVNPEARPGGSSAKASLIERGWSGAQGLAEDVRYYGKWMRDEAERRIGHLYPPVEVTAEMVRERPDLKQYQGRKLTVIAWLWARTVKSPNPAFADVDVPLASTFMLSTKRGKEAYVEPVIEGRGYRFEVKVGKPPDAEAAKGGTKLARGANFRCVMSGSPMAGDYIKAEGKAGRMGARLMAIVAGGDRGRVYLSPTPEHETVAREPVPEWKPEGDVPARLTGGTCVPYGLTTWGDLFTPRQLVALTTFSDLVAEAMERVKQDAATDGPEDGGGLDEGGCGARAYVEAVGLYLGLAASRASDSWSTIVSWRNSVEATRGTFARQALPMVWDYAEANPFSESCGNWSGACLEWVKKAVAALPSGTSTGAFQADAATQTISNGKIISTDPPYYDNIGYADLSDFFYVWLRRTVRSIHPDLFATLAVPKAEELVATPYRHGNKEIAEAFFLGGMTEAMSRLAEQAHPGFPVTIYYAFKQSEKEGDTGIFSTGWETFLAAVIQSGFALTGTWPMRTERGGRMLGIGTNSLASSIVLVCCKRPQDAPLATRREFVAALKAELPAALAHLQSGNIAPVDLAQAAIGPGMAVYTRYAKVLDAQGNPVFRARRPGADQPHPRRSAWRSRKGNSTPTPAGLWLGSSSTASPAASTASLRLLATAKNTSVSGMVEAGILESRAGEVRLLRPEELPEDWDPAADRRLPVWEVVHHLVRVLESAGETGAARLVRQLGGIAETARELAYRLYAVAERKNRAAEALSYNGLVQSWPEIARLAKHEAPDEQGGLFSDGDMGGAA